jgi:para-aminobenzoate synthetase component 1
LELKNLLNRYGSLKEPFLFIIDFKLKNYDIIPLNKLPKDIKYQIESNNINKDKIEIEKHPISFDEYEKKFYKVQNEIREGNTYLLNLTSKTSIKTDKTLDEIYNKANARFKLYYKDKFVCFSPERFVKIEDNKIYTFPMKGTIDANIPNAKEKILNDKKELAEHTMVVDLLRNDLSIVSKRVKVESFRYCEKINAGDKELLQISSKISGELDNNWQGSIGDILSSLLPAGSITGTPKKKTVEIIKEVENFDREYFTGVFGIFDGESLDSGVMIRFIQKDEDNNLIYKSGGGITCDSDVKSEYLEMCDKVYIP